MKKKKVTYVVSLIEKSLGFEWTAVRLSQAYNLTFILLNPEGSPLEDFLRSNGIPTRRFRYRGKGDLPITVLKLCAYFFRERPSVVHTHLFDATLAGLAAAWFTRVKARIYTRHNSTYHHVYFPRAVLYDRICNWLATRVVSVSQATDKVLKMEKVPDAKVRRIPHGLDFDAFSNISEERITAVAGKWGIPLTGMRIGVIARHIEWKGVQYIVPAFRHFLTQKPAAVILLANASGPYHSEILELLRDVPKDRYILIPFEEDVAALYRLMDVYVHTPVDGLCEAFGQTYVEALASGVPSIFTPSGIAAEFIKHNHNAWVAEFKSESSVEAGLKTLTTDSALCSRLIENGRADVFSRYSIGKMIDGLRQLYDE